MAEKLAKSQGGCSESAHAQNAESSGKTQNIEEFLEKGDQILDNFKSSIQAFESHSGILTTLGQTVKALQKDVSGMKSLKRKSIPDTAIEPNQKRQCQDEISDVESNDESSSGEMSDSEGFFEATHDNVVEEEQECDFLDELDSFFVEETVLGDNVSEKIGQVVNRSLRGNPDDDKLKALQEKYKRPANIDNIQIPKIDTTLWEQIKQRTKTGDYSRQRVIGHLNQVMLPLIKAMEIIEETGRSKGSNTEIKLKTQFDKLKECVGDSFKMICQTIRTTNRDRREIVKKEMAPKFKKLCGDDHPASASKLFGDNFVEDIKQLDASKTVKLTTNVTTLKPAGFLGKREGFQQPNNSGAPHQPQNKTKQYKGQNAGQKWRPPGQHGYYGNGKTSQPSQQSQKQQWPKSRKHQK